jgi:hypothetical protein
MAPFQILGIRHGVGVLVVLYTDIIWRGCNHQVDWRHTCKVGFQYVSVEKSNHRIEYDRTRDINQLFISLSDFSAFFIF